MSFSDSNEWLKGNSMFDWPLQIQTSPTRTFFSSILFLPSTINMSGPPAFWTGSFTFHFPSLAVAEAFLPRKLTVTSSPASAQPQMGARTPCCNTMPSEKRPGSLTSARASSSVEQIRTRHSRSKMGKRLFGIMRDSATQGVACVNRESGLNRDG